MQSNANKTASNSTAIWNLLLGVFFQIQTTFKLAFNRPKSLQVTEVRCPQKIHSGANSTFIFKLLKDFDSIGKARQESKVFARFRFPFHNWWKFRAKSSALMVEGVHQMFAMPGLEFEWLLLLNRRHNFRLRVILQNPCLPGCKNLYLTKVWKNVLV